ncbi:MAG: family 16 glycosylhydrolase [Granulosicoccus sp.]
MLKSRLLRILLVSIAVIGIFPAFALALDAPRDLRGTEIGQNVVKWEWASVSGAVEYEVTVNGNMVGKTSADEFKSRDLNPGTHHMTVRAIAADGTRSDPTPLARIKTSVEFNYGLHGRSYLVAEVAGDKFGVPKGVWGKQIEPGKVHWGWNEVAGAESYDVFIDGRYRATSHGRDIVTANLASGERAMSVRAVSADRRISDHSDTVRVVVSGGAEAAASAPAAPAAPSQIPRSTVAPENTNGVEIAPGEVLWGWSRVGGAVRYEVFVDGKWAGQSTENQWISRDLWVGEHSMSVKAIYAGGKLSPLSKTAKVWVSKPQTAETAPAPPPPQPQVTGGNPDAINVESLVDPDSYNDPQVYKKMGEGWELSFSDEFNGTGLNPYRWHSQMRWDGEWNGERYEYRIINKESQFYVNIYSEDEEHLQKIAPLHNPYKFDGSRLAIQAIRNPLRDAPRGRMYGRLEDVARQQPFLSGAISTHEKFAQMYGWFEARIKIPNHVGAFPAFWLFHERRAWQGTQRTEIDIMENLGHAPHFIYNSFHYFTDVSTTFGGNPNHIKPTPSGQIRGDDYSADYFVYAVKWEPGKITYYVNGEPVSEVRNGNSDFEPLYIMLNLAMGGVWTNYGTNAGGLGRPAGQSYPTDDDINQFSNPQLEIDYVRVYKPR